MDTIEILEREIIRIEERLNSAKYAPEIEAQLHDALIRCLSLHANVTRV